MSGRFSFCSYSGVIHLSAAIQGMNERRSNLYYKLPDGERDFFFYFDVNM